MEQRIKKRFLEAARSCGPKNITDEQLEKFQVAVMNKTAIKKTVKDINQEFGLNVPPQPFANIARAITLGEVGKTILEYPHLHKHQVLALFENMALVNKGVQISSTGITRPMLIDMVEALEDYTGLKITDDNNPNAPLAYLDQKCNTLSIEDISDFFSGRKDTLIEQIITGMKEAQATLPEKSQDSKKNLRKAVKSYLASSCGCKVDEIDETQPIISLAPEAELADTQNEPYFLVVMWLESQFNKIVPNDFVQNKSIKELLDLMSE